MRLTVLVIATKRYPPVCTGNYTSFYIQLRFVQNALRLLLTNYVSYVTKNATSQAEVFFLFRMSDDPVEVSSGTRILGLIGPKSWLL